MTEKVESKEPTKKVRCVCRHPWQDGKYGHGIRIHNRKPYKNGTNWRCTVCRNEIA